MGHKKRGYKRELPRELVRDYTLLAIACEGGKREPDYFKVFEHLSDRIKVDVIFEENEDSEHFENISNRQTKSAPRWVLDKAIKYIEKEGLIDEDQLWFVMDVDKWHHDQLREIADYCAEKHNWHIVLSNPCFEVWLYFHKSANISLSASITCSDFKNEISKFEKGGYHPLKFIPQLPEAIENARFADSNNGHFFPKLKESKVYLLGDAIIKIASLADFDHFLNHTLPRLKKQELGERFQRRAGKK
ncbi:MAG: RloB family protein [bacterium]